MKELVIFFHGYNSNHKEIKSHFKLMDSQGGITSIGFDAPHTCDLNSQNKQWFKFSKINDYLSKQIIKESQDLLEKIKKIYSKKTFKKITLIGHSQGAMIVAYLGMTTKMNLNCICISGMIPFIEKIDFLKIKNKITFIHGAEDDMINFQKVQSQVQLLNSKGVYVDLFKIENTGHNLNSKTVERTMNLFLIKTK
jgi:predicted esterase